MALAFDPDTAEILFHDAANLVALRGALLLHVSRRPLRVTDLKVLAATLGARPPAPGVARGAYLTVIEESTARPLTAALREQQSALSRQALAPERAWAATIVPDGWVLRTALQALSLGAGATYKTFAKPREAAEWIAQHVPVPVNDIRAFVAWGRQLPFDEPEV